MSPPSPVAVALLDDLTSRSAAFKNGEDGARQDLISACSRLIAELSHPTENALNLLWAQPAHLSVIRTGVEIQLFQALAPVTEAGETSAQIAKRCVPSDIDPLLVGRMLRHLAAMSTVRETGPDTFAPTPTSRAYAQPGYQDTILYIVDDYQPALDATPAYFRANSFQMPRSSVDAPFQFAFDCKDLHYFEYFAKRNPEMGRRFASMMDIWSQGRSRWFQPDYYPVAARLIDDAKPDLPFLVDVGGGTGHDVNGLRDAFGDVLPGPLVLQDRPEIIELARIDERDHKMTHDFLTEQPVKGARAYYLHSIIQDWQDDVITHILRSLVPALTRGYSKILINDFVVPNVGAHWKQTALDWELLACLGARHRTAAEHEKLYQKAGFKVNGIWKCKDGLDAVIELELE